MKAWIFGLGLLLFVITDNRAQGSYNNPSLDQLRDDYNASTLVVRVAVEGTRPPTDKEAVYRCICHAKFVGAYKGEVRKGDRIDFFVAAKDVCDPDVYQGNRFVFLLRRFNRQLNLWVYEQWAIYPFTKDTLAKLRKLRNGAWVRK